MSQTTPLLDRLEDSDLVVLAFLLNPNVPFTNNQADQHIRMTKVKQKISDCFRTLPAAQAFAQIRSYLSTGRKKGHNLCDACLRLVLSLQFFQNNPAKSPYWSTIIIRPPWGKLIVIAQEITMAAFVHHQSLVTTSEKSAEELVLPIKARREPA